MILLQFQTILLPYKLALLIKECRYVKRGCDHENPYSLTVFSAVPSLSPHNVQGLRNFSETLKKMKNWFNWIGFKSWSILDFRVAATVFGIRQSLLIYLIYNSGLETSVSILINKQTLGFKESSLLFYFIFSSRSIMIKNVWNFYAMQQIVGLFSFNIWQLEKILPVWKMAIEFPSDSCHLEQQTHKMGWNHIWGIISKRKITLEHF